MSEENTQSQNSSKKILGLEPGNYVKTCYLLTLISGAVSILSSLAGLVGTYIPGSGIIGLLGFFGVVMALVGYFGFKEDFEDFLRTHLGYLSAIFGIFFVASMFLGAMLGGVGVGLYILIFLVALTQTAALYVGFTLWQARTPASKDAAVEQAKKLIEQLKQKSNQS